MDEYYSGAQSFITTLSYDSMVKKLWILLKRLNCLIVIHCLIPKEAWPKLTTIEHIRYGTVNVRGEIELGYLYNTNTKTVDINIKQCKDLAPVDTKRNRSDP